MRTTIHITTKDRATEVAILLQSLRTQSYQDWDLMILDDCSGTPLESYGFIQSLLARIKLENHKVKVLRNDFSKGVCAARQKLIDEDTWKNELVLRLDDDCIPEEDYIARLVGVIESGWDMATGVIPLLAHPELIRDTKRVMPGICIHELDKKGNLIRNDDELAYCYDKEGIATCHQFRTNCLFKKEVLEKVRYPENLSRVGFREEAFISVQAQVLGFKIGADLGAVAYHFQTGSGGCRDPDYSNKVQLDDTTFREWLKEQHKKHKEVFK